MWSEPKGLLLCLAHGLMLVLCPEVRDAQGIAVVALAGTGQVR